MDPDTETRPGSALSGSSQRSSSSGKNIRQLSIAVSSARASSSSSNANQPRAVLEDRGPVMAMDVAAASHQRNDNAEHVQDEQEEETDDDQAYATPPAIAMMPPTPTYGHGYGYSESSRHGLGLQGIHEYQGNMSGMPSTSSPRSRIDSALSSTTSATSSEPVLPLGSFGAGSQRDSLNSIVSASTAETSEDAHGASQQPALPNTRSKPEEATRMQSHGNRIGIHESSSTVSVHSHTSHTSHTSASRTLSERPSVASSLSRQASSTLSIPLNEPASNSPSHSRLPGSFVEGERTFVSTASGALGRLSPQVQQQSNTSSSSPSANRKSFFASLLHRSSSFNGRSSASLSSIANGSGAPHSPVSRSSSQSTSVPRPSSVQAHRRTRVASNPSSPSPSRHSFASPPYSQRMPPAPSAHDAVFSSPVMGVSNTSLPVLADPASPPQVQTPSSRAQRFRTPFTSPSAGSEHPVRGTDNSRSPSSAQQRFPRGIPAGLRSASLDTHSPGQKQPVHPSEPTLDSIGLSLLQLSPNLTIGRFGQPLCGAVLDGKYLLIGTTLGLDFLPLHRQGNRSMRGGLFERFTSQSSAGDDFKTRKPISLIKKTRFRQLIVLSERSNVLLAVAGRNDHVRVYALDSLRAVIDKKMREIDDKEGLARYTMRTPPVPPIPAAYKDKGKGRASPLPPPLPLGSYGAASQGMQSEVTASSWVTQPSPPPAYNFPEHATSYGSNFAREGLPSASSISSGRLTPRRQSKASIHGSTPSHSLPSPSLREHSVTSPRAMKRAKSRETLRRPSVASGVGSRRGSAATVTPGTIAAVARRRSSVATLHTQSQSSSSAQSRSSSSAQSRSSSSARGPSTAPAATRADLNDEDEDYEWINAMEEMPTTSVSHPGSPIISTSPTAHTTSNGQWDAYGARDRQASLASGTSRSSASKMIARSPVARQAEENAPEGEEETDENEASRPARRLNKRRVSLADILKESRVASPAEPLPTMVRSASAGVIGQHRPLAARPMARSPTSSSISEDLASLADFIRAGPPVSPRISRVKSTSPRPEMDGNGLLKKNKLLPRAPVLQVEESTGFGTALLDIMRQGPPVMEPSTSGSSEGDSQEPPARRQRRISKPKSRKPSVEVQSVRPMPGMSSPEAAVVQDPLSSSPSSGLTRQRTMTSPEMTVSPSLASSRAAKRMSYQPRPPTVASEHEANFANGSMSRSFSLQEMLANMPAPPPSLPISPPSQDEYPASPLQRSSTQMSNRSTSSQQPRQRNKKRWSLLTGLRSGGSPGMGSSSLTPSSSLQSNLAAPASESSTPSSPVIPQTQTGSSPGPGHGHSDSVTSNLSYMTTRERPETAMSEAIIPVTPAVPVLKPRPPHMDDEHGPFANLTPDTEAIQHAPDGTTITYTRTDVTTSGTSSGAVVHGSLNNGAPAVPGTLDYVKLARTKGSRFIRASETSKRTYLAVLCGDTGERIELFTGSKNVSLSLNRTFVLPETPRTIEFQLQGEDLIDLYLIYDSAIFALEPSTVRVREVGIQRNERRQARRERDRLAREQAVLDETQPRADAPSPQAPPVPRTGGAESPPMESMDRLPDAPVAAAAPEEPAVAEIPVPERNAEEAVIDEALPESLGSTTNVPYTTFQQLEYLPTVPPSVLSASYVIPPTYEAVLSASPMPAQNGFAPSSRTDSPAMSMASTDSFLTASTAPGTPLLSPVSLLANPTARNPGPPGLFFVSKGRHMTGIVDGDGRSVIKKPLSWLSPDAPSTTPLEQAQGLDIFTRLEILLADDGSKVCLAAFGPTAARVLEIGGDSEQSVEIISPEAVKKRNKSLQALASVGLKEGEESFVRDVTYLAKAGEASFFAERIGSGITIHALAATGQPLYQQFSVPSVRRR